MNSAEITLSRISIDPALTIHTLDFMNEPTEKPTGPRQASLCPCKSRETYGACCEPLHLGLVKPETAVQLMRSRYSAYFFRLVDYLVTTTHPDSLDRDLKARLEEAIHVANWRFLTILGSSKGGPGDKVGKVEFTAEYFEDGQARELHERSRLKRYQGAWKYLDAKG